ncbi:MAG: response regulator, partial [Myxococcales bacterium]|nr:response regulator [Myxococcales bacterium]
MKRVLVVDDGVENRYLLTALLEGNGFQVVQASNGAEALALAREAAPDIVVTDILMPTMDGFELCRRWRMDERLKGIPFIVYTATYTEPKDEKLALALGADRFLIKPQQPEVLLRVVNEVLAEAASHPGDVVQRPRLDELEALRRHNEALIAKLEKKVHQLEDEAKKRTDVTAALQESERWFRLLAENSSDVVWSMGFDGRILYVSPAVEALLGYKPQELREVPFEKMVAPEGQALLRDEMRKVLEDLAAGRNPKHSDRYEVEMVRRDGTRVWTEISASIMWDESGKAGGFQGVLRDISGRRLLEEDRERLKLQHMQTQRLESIGRLAGGVAHDFNNLLSVIISYADFVAEEMRPEDPLRADVQEIHKAGKRAATLTRQLLAFSRKQVMELQVMDLNQTVAGLQDMLRRLIGEDI